MLSTNVENHATDHTSGLALPSQVVIKCGAGTATPMLASPVRIAPSLQASFVTPKSEPKTNQQFDQIWLNWSIPFLKSLSPPGASGLSSGAKKHN